MSWNHYAVMYRGCRASICGRLDRIVYMDPLEGEAGCKRRAVRSSETRRLERRTRKTSVTCGDRHDLRVTHIRVTFRTDPLVTFRHGSLGQQELVFWRVIGPRS